MSARTFADARAWVATGTELVSGQLTALSEDDYEAPSALPGWSRKNLVAHLSGNAEAIGNLVGWAATGRPRPMYASPEARNATIEAGALRSGEELTSEFNDTAATLAESMDALTEEQWTHEVVTAQGRTVPATEVPWMRAREVMVHAVDLQAGVTFADLPAPFLIALCEDIVAKRNAAAGTPNEGPALHIVATDAELQWDLTGSGDAASITGPLSEITAYLAGRDHESVVVADGELPALPAWL